ncbi:MAG: HlyC/CorC family transporter [Chloroflexi bacterium]|nr:HlyC/CorC family transporter [Chloroflexota bacterium]
MLEILIWLVFLAVAIAATVVQTITTCVHEVESAVVAENSARLRRVRLWSGIAAALARAIATAVAVFALWNAQADGWLIALGAGMTIVLALGLQFVARHLARRNLERLAAPLLGDAIVFLPLVEPRAEPLQEEETREEAVEQMVDASEKAGLIESDEHAMITGVLQLDRTLTREIMVPRIDVIAVEVETPLRNALDVVIAGAHARVPVYEESIDHVVGLLYAKDLLKVWRDGKIDVPLRSLLRPAYFVPESKRLDELLQELQRTKVHMAIVIDEFGGTAGIVTIEDVLEEIVGEIQDEYDTGEEPLVERVNEFEGVFNARVTIDDVNDALALNLPDEGDSLGGLVYQRLEKMPKVGDQVRVGNAAITVMNVVGRRIKQVRVSKLVNSEQWDSE